MINNILNLRQIIIINNFSSSYKSVLSIIYGQLSQKVFFKVFITKITLKNKMTKIVFFILKFLILILIFFFTFKLISKTQPFNYKLKV